MLSRQQVAPPSEITKTTATHAAVVSQHNMFGGREPTYLLMSVPCQGGIPLVLSTGIVGYNGFPLVYTTPTTIIWQDGRDIRSYRQGTRILLTGQPAGAVLLGAHDSPLSLEPIYYTRHQGPGGLIYQAYYGNQLLVSRDHSFLVVPQVKEYYTQLIDQILPIVPANLRRYLIRAVGRTPDPSVKAIGPRVVVVRRDPARVRVAAS